TPEGRRRVDELLDQLSASAPGRDWVLRFATERKLEADLGRTIDTGDTDPGRRLTPDELDRLRAGFTTIRDQEPLDDVADWANAGLQLLAEGGGWPGYGPGSKGTKTAMRVLAVLAAVAAVPAFHVSVRPLPEPIHARLAATSWHAGCPVPLSDLRLLRVT